MKGRDEQSCALRKQCKVRQSGNCSLDCKSYRWDESTYPTHDQRLTPFQRKLIEAMVRMNHDILDLAKASGLPPHTLRMSVTGRAVLSTERKAAIAKGLRLSENYFEMPVDEAV